MPPLMNYEAFFDYNSSDNLYSNCLAEEDSLLVTQPTKKRRLNSPLKKKKSVQFSEFSMAYRSDRTQEEIQRSWYTREEIVTLKREKYQFIRALEQVHWNVDAMDETKHCTRGFEVYFSKQINKDVRDRRTLVIQSVLNEQRRQQSNDETIRTVSTTASHKARDVAFEIGMQDSNVSLMDTLLLEMPLLVAADDDDWNPLPAFPIQCC